MMLYVVLLKVLKNFDGYRRIEPMEVVYGIRSDWLIKPEAELQQN
jgi:hypothetical protein